MNITIINDCTDANAVGRQIARIQALIGGSISFVGVNNDLEAAGNLIDVLDAYGDVPALILVNVAPRSGRSRKWPNGTPFGYARYKSTLIVGTIDGYVWSLIKKLRLINEVHVLDIPTVIEGWVSAGYITSELGAHIVTTQFRSYDFVPRVAAYLLEHRDVVSEVVNISEFPDAPDSVWWVDNFGNCKTTLLTGEGRRLEGYTYYDRLKDVPHGQTAVITGSSGLGDARFLEIVVQGQSASQVLGIAPGTLLPISEQQRGIQQYELLLAVEHRAQPGV